MPEIRCPAYRCTGIVDTRLGEPAQCRMAEVMIVEIVYAGTVANIDPSMLEGISILPLCEDSSDDLASPHKEKVEQLLGNHSTLPITELTSRTRNPVLDEMASKFGRHVGFLEAYLTFRLGPSVRQQSIPTLGCHIPQRSSRAA